MLTSGTFRTAPKSRRDDSTEYLQAFFEFLKQPDYAGHLYAGNWKAKLDKQMPLAELLEKNLRILRECKNCSDFQKQEHRFQA